MLRDDLRTVLEIVRKKRKVRSLILETREWCIPGLWYIEGPYARHRRAELPGALRDSIRGIRNRQLARELSERLVPPWACFVRGETEPSGQSIQCTIGYLSNGGNWKLFDMENETVWSRPISSDHLSRQVANLEQFNAYFDIPAWNVLERGDVRWRSDAMLVAPNLAACSAREREATVRILLGQFADFAREHATPPEPEVTVEAIGTIQAVAPESFPALIAERNKSEFMSLSQRAPFVPDHGDLSGQNILVSGGRPWVIDWDTAGLPRPLLYDFHYLVLREADLQRPDLLDGYVRGVFDADIENVYRAAGVEKPECENFVALMHAYVLHFSHKYQMGHRDANRQNVIDLWGRLRESKSIGIRQYFGV